MASLVVLFGDPTNRLGADLSVSALELNPLGRRGAFGLKQHARLEDGSSVALGLENFGVWGMTDGGTSVYAVYDRSFSLG